MSFYMYKNSLYPMSPWKKKNPALAWLCKKLLWTNHPAASKVFACYLFLPYKPQVQIGQVQQKG